ncbi:MAG: TIR domain-containing protein [Chloroflexi bacterium]|nr:TIR domain-containing protein [Chloroflexota bacterium]
MAKFFITHSWKDIEFARRLFKDLKAHGVEGWMDDTAVRGGERMAEKINEGLEGCDIYLPIFSPAALESLWCWEEINAAIALANRAGRARKLTIIPIIALKCEIPALLSARLYFDFVERYDAALAELLSKGFGVTAPIVPTRSVHPAPVEHLDEPPAAKPKSKTSPVPVAKAEPPAPPRTALEDAENLYLEALEAFHLEKWQLAAATFRKVVALQADYEDAAAKLKDAERAQRAAELSARYDAATKSIEAGDWHAAIEQLETLLEIDGGYRDARARLASAKNMLRAADLYMQAREALAAKKWNDAVRVLESLLTLAPNYQDAATKLTEAKRWAQLPDLYRRALKAIDVKQWQDAQALLEQVSGVDANYREAKTLLTRVNEQARQALLAELYDRATQAIDAKKWQDAKTLLEQIQKVDANYREIKTLLARAERELARKDMILIPAGEFVMGSNEYDREKPPHKVYVDAFYIARFPVTNAEYKKFVDATKHNVPFADADWAKPYNWDQKARTYPKGREDHPVVLVSWNDVVAYCKWAGVRLPTEAEWEKAASWDDAKKEKRVYPWGKDFDKNKCNTKESGIGGTTSVGGYSAKGGDSPYGIADMAGNVWEWCSSRWGKNSDKPDFNYPYRADDGREDMQSDDRRILRGGSWLNNVVDARCAYRGGLLPDYRLYSIGFRVAESVTP